VAATHAIELNSAGLHVAGPGGASAPVPVVAAYEGERVVVGAEAAARARLAPLWTAVRHLEELSTDPLPRPKPFARSNADLVYAQLVALAAEHGLAGQPVLVAAPGAYSTDQLRLLLGIAAAADLPVAGLVDAAVAACADVPSTPRAFHLDLEQHRAVLTELVRGDDLRRGRVDVSRAVGRRAYADAHAQLLARLFVRATRFDPLHLAGSEQALYDRLDEWIAAAARGDAPVALEYGGLRHETTLTAAQLQAASEPLHAELLRLVHSARRAGEAVTLYVTDRVARLPAVDGVLARLRDCEVVRLAPGAAATGALAHATEIAGPVDAAAAGATESAGVALANRLRAVPALVPEHGSAADRGSEAPTHLVHLGRAYPLGEEPLVLGRGASGPRSVDVAGAAAGVSRSHCTLVRRGGEAVLEDHSTYGTFLNGERVQRRAQLAAGDRVRVGTPGVEFELVRIAEADGGRGRGTAPADGRSPGA
jgi:hypothetical protein